MLTAKKYSQLARILHPISVKVGGMHNAKLKIPDSPYLKAKEAINGSLAFMNTFSLKSEGQEIMLDFGVNVNCKEIYPVSKKSTSDFSYST